MTILTQAMLDAAPAIDIHVHVQGTISARTAWKLGVMNGLIDEKVCVDENGERYFKGEKLNPASGFEYYGDMFTVNFDEQGKIVDAQYKFLTTGNDKKFDVFDRIMAVVQGHRHKPGGMQSEADYRFAMREYLKSCLKQNITYTELQQNIKIAYSLYPTRQFPHMSEWDKRLRFYGLLNDIKAEFLDAGVDLNFLNCYNKTRAAGNPLGHDPSMESAQWLMETKHYYPGLFIGMVSAGSEKDETGWPAFQVEGYRLARENGFVVETHSGEGIGSAHMRLNQETLHPQRNAHGFQGIEDVAIFELLRADGTILLMSPMINVYLGCKVYETDGIPTPKEWGGTKKYISKVGDHPFFPMLREHGLEIALVSDDPEMGGVPYKEMIAHLAGLISPENLNGTPPLTAEEFCVCQLNAINRSGGTETQKRRFAEKMQEFMYNHGLRVEHPVLETHSAKAYQQKLESLEMSRLR